MISNLMKCFVAIMLLLCSASSLTACDQFVDIEIYVRRFEMDRPIANASLFAISEGEKFFVGQTDDKGTLLIKWPAKKGLTLYLERSFLGFFPGIHSAYLEPGPQGLTGKFQKVTFQVPYYGTFWLLEVAMNWRYHARAKPDSCQVVTTITPEDKTLDDCPHGYPGAKVWLEPNNAEATYYFDMVRQGHFSCKTDIFINLLLYSYINFLYHNLSNPNHTPDVEHKVHDPLSYLSLQQTSEDGGVMFLNVKAGVNGRLYSVKVEDTKNPAKKFTEVKFMCYPGALINISPPQGPKPVTGQSFHNQKKAIEEYRRRALDQG